MSNDYSYKARGFALVFSRDTPQFYCEIKEGKLQVSTKEDFEGDKKICGCKVRRKIRKAIRDPSNILKALEDVGLEYILTESPDPMRRYIIAIVTAPVKMCEDWGEIKGLQLEIEPKEAVKQGRKNPGFMLAHRTYVEILDNDNTFRDYIEHNDENDEFIDASTGYHSSSKNDGYYQLSNDDVNNNSSLGGIGGDSKVGHIALDYSGSEVEYKMLPLSLWKGIHVQFDLSRVPRAVYKKDKHGDILNNVAYLRILFGIITESRKQGGANYNLPRYIRLTNHPLISYFALNCGRRPAIKSTREVIGYKKVDGLSNLWNHSIHKIRDYYGEHIAYYMSFLSHYTVWLIYLLPVAIVWQIYTSHFINSKNQNNDNLIPNGSHYFAMIYLVWGSLMLEYWYRREARLSVQWGSFDQGEHSQSLSRPTFRGQTELSPVNGDIIQTYSNRWAKYLKMLVSMSGIYTFMAAVIVTVVLIWKLRSRDDLQANREFTVAIGISNAIQIQIFNYLYVYFATYVNEWENHRLESEYYNNLVIKRIFFLLVNSFNSVFYLTFYKNFGSGRHSRIQRLKAVRIQLNTLFWTEIIIQNMTEVILPKISRYLEDRKWKQHAREAGISDIYSNDEPAIVAHSKYGMITPEMLARNAYVKPSFAGVGNTNANVVSGAKDEDSKSDADVTEECELLSIWPDVVSDLEAQLQSNESPEVLDNTAEIVLHYGYVILFAVIFPIMPLLSLLNNFIEFAVDFHNYTHSQRPVPHSSKGIGVWKPVIASFTILGVFTNFAFLFFKSDVFDHFKWGSTRRHFIYWVVCLSISLALSLLKYAIPDQSKHTRESVLRQRLVEKELLLIGNNQKDDDQQPQSKAAQKAVQKWRAQLKRQQSKQDMIEQTRQRYAQMSAAGSSMIIPTAPPGETEPQLSNKDSIDGLI